MSRTADTQQELEALREREERSRIISELASDYAYVARVDAQATLVSEWTTDAFTQVTGYTPEELDSAGAWRRLFHPDDVAIVRDHVEALLSGEAHVCEYRIITRGGDVRWLRDHARPVWDDDQSRIVSVYGAAEDITERKQAESQRDAMLEALRLSEARCRAVVEDQTELICRFQPDGTLIFVNEAYCRYFGMQSEEMIGSSFIPMMSDEERATFAKLVSSLSPDKPVITVEHRSMLASGEGRWLQWTTRAVFDVHGQLAEIQSVGRDITERRRTEDTLRQRTLELQARNEELDAFAHIVAHDVKHPLTLMISFAELLMEQVDTVPAEKALQYLGAIARNGRKMSQIIDELLLLSRLPRDDVELEPLDMAYIVAEAQFRLTDMIEQYQAKIDCPDTWPVALGYGPWIEVVWVNFLSNAIQYGGRPPRIELGADLLGDDTIRFWVRDHGPGLSAEEQARLFAPFTQLRDSQARGHGLGLSIIRRIMNKLGGQVGVESEGLPDQGCTFFFSLPASRESTRGDDSQIGSV
jgi:PAS domain S-box-containing protein